MDRIREQLSYANVVATVALFVALGGGAYALTRDSVRSKHIVDQAVKSVDIKNRGVKARDVARGAIRGRHVVERTLAIADVIDAASARDDVIPCNPTSTARIDCVSLAFRLPQRSKVLVFGGGDQYGQGGAARGGCILRGDGGRARISGRTETAIGGGGHTDPASANPFFLAGVTEKLTRGLHTFAVACNESDGDTRISNGGVTLLAVSARGG